MKKLESCKIGNNVDDLRQLVLVGLGNNNLNSAGANQTWPRLRFTQADTIFQVRESSLLTSQSEPR